MVAEALAPPPDAYAFVAGDDGADGIAYVGGAPMVVLDGAPVFLAYGDGLGWGYYDHWHHWHGAPDRFREHMEHYHPYGSGLRGYHRDAFGHDVGFHREAAFRREEAFHREAAFHREGELRHEEAMHREGGFAHAEAMRHEGGLHPATGRAGMTVGPAGHAEAAARPGFVHPGPMASAGGFHPGAPAGVHPGAPVSGGFHPGAPAGGFHPVAAHAAPAVAHVASAPAKHH